MGRSAKKIARIVGIAALVATGVGFGLAVAGGSTLAGIGSATAFTVAGKAIAIKTLFNVAVLGLTIGTLPGKPKRIEDTGADQRGRISFDPNALAVFAFGRTTVPASLADEMRDV